MTDGADGGEAEPSVDEANQSLEIQSVEAPGYVTYDPTGSGAPEPAAASFNPPGSPDTGPGATGPWVPYYSEVLPIYVMPSPRPTGPGSPDVASIFARAEPLPPGPTGDASAPAVENDVVRPDYPDPYTGGPKVDPFTGSPPSNPYMGGRASSPPINGGATTPSLDPQVLSSAIPGSPADPSLTTTLGLLSAPLGGTAAALSDLLGTPVGAPSGVSAAGDLVTTLMRSASFGSAPSLPPAASVPGAGVGAVAVAGLAAVAIVVHLADQLAETNGRMEEALHQHQSVQADLDYLMWQKRANGEITYDQWLLYTNTGHLPGITEPSASNIEVESKDGTKPSPYVWKPPIVLAQPSVVEAIPLEPYGVGGGHHPAAQAAFRSALGYDPRLALAIPDSVLEEMGGGGPRAAAQMHSVITRYQLALYRDFIETGQPITWDVVRAIEIEALVHAGVDSATAEATVDEARADLQSSGVPGPARIPGSP